MSWKWGHPYALYPNPPAPIPAMDRQHCMLPSRPFCLRHHSKTTNFLNPHLSGRALGSSHFLNKDIEVLRLKHTCFLLLGSTPSTPFSWEPPLTLQRQHCVWSEYTVWTSGTGSSDWSNNVSREGLRSPDPQHLELSLICCYQ